MKDLVDSLGMNSDVTRIFYGSVNLVLKNPDQYRSDLIDVIFEDLDSMEKRLAGKLELYPTGMTGRVQLKQFSETEVELWIPYGYETKSIRAMELEKRENLAATMK